MGLNGVEPEFWRGKRVLITGHTGFKGSWLTKALLDLGAEVTGYSLAPETDPNLFKVLGLGSAMRSIFADIRDRQVLVEAVQSLEPEIVFHLAAQPLVGRAFREPVYTLETNVIGTANLFDAVRETPSVKAVLCVTTDKVYDNKEWVWPYREDDALGGKEPYGISKACCEMVVDAYRHSYFDSPERTVAIASARAGNIIGGGDWSENRLLPDAVRAFSCGSPLRVRNPASVRPWQHVLEVVRGYLILAEGLIRSPAQCSRAWNFGPRTSDARTVEEIATIAVGAWGGDARWEALSLDQPYEAKLLTLDSSLAEAELGWHPKYDLEANLEATVTWYRKFYNAEDMQDITEWQINDYLNLMISGKNR